MMREIQLRDAKAKLSAVVDGAVRGEPSIITRHGRKEAVILSFKEWERLSQAPSFGRLLMAAPIAPEDLPDRNRTAPRAAISERRVYLVDTNVISAGAPSKGRACGAHRVDGCAVRVVVAVGGDGHGDRRRRRQAAAGARDSQER